MPNEDIQPIVILPTFCGETECGRGAEIACRTIYAQITGTVRDGGDLTRITDQDVKNWIAASREAIVADAQEHGKLPREYACTILGAVAGNDRVAGNGKFFPVPVPAGTRCINACATSGGFTRDTGNPPTGRKIYAAGNWKRVRRITPLGVRAIRCFVQQENPGDPGWMGLSWTCIGHNQKITASLS